VVIFIYFLFRIEHFNMEGR